jgi:ribosomal protein L37AE/L43A
MFQRFLAKLSAGMRNFMAGRYGTDRLNTTILAVGVIFYLISMFVPVAGAKLGLIGAAYALMVWAIFRSFSRNTYKRYRENRKFLQLLDRIKDREHRYFSCPKCHQPVRVPRGKGKISITCPRCAERFIRKS